MDRIKGDGAAEPIDAKSEVARSLIEAMRAGNTPWQRPWSAKALCPVGSTGRPYQGVNRLLLSIAGADIAARLGAPPDPRWTTYAQAAANGWQVRRGERGSPIVKVVELGARSDGPAREPSAEVHQAPARRALRRYVVFNASQIDGMPPPEPEEAPSFEPVARAEAIMEALKTRTGLDIVVGGDSACYIPSKDRVMLPSKSAFRELGGVSAAYGFYSVALHECGHATSSEKRLKRELSKRFGDEAYALEELTVEIASACLAAETGTPIVEARPAAHVERHAAYLGSWIKAIERDPNAIFAAARGAETICAYLLGLEREARRSDEIERWADDYRREEARHAER